jgi:hypothetical protein
MDRLVTSVLTLGYDADTKKYVGIWIDSFNSYLWKYEGTVNAAANALTLETEGPCPMAPGTLGQVQGSDRGQKQRPQGFHLLHAERGWQMGYHCDH